MARPAKSVNTMSRHNTKSDISKRRETESKLRGDNSLLTPPDWLSARQREVFEFVVSELAASEILGNLDVFVLAKFAVAVSRLEELEKLFNADLQRLADKELKAIHAIYTKDFFRCCNELSLSPQARAKIGTLSLERDRLAQDPVLAILEELKR